MRRVILNVHGAGYNAAALAGREGAVAVKWRILGGAVALAAAGWSGWWFIGAAAHDAALRGWLADRRADGWQAEIAGLETQGFPNRFDTRLTGLALADPGAGWAWSAPFLDIVMLSYAPNRAIVAFAPEQTLAVPGAQAGLRSEGLRASVRFAPGPSLALTRASLEGSALALEGRGWRAAAQSLNAHVLESDPATAPADSYDVYFAAEGVAPSRDLRDLIDPAGALPELAQALRLDARLALDRPLDRFAVEDAAPQITALSLTAFEAQWGALSLRASGLLRADAEGYAEGEIAVQARNWREMLRAGVAAGALSADLGAALETALSLVAMLGGDQNAIAAPLRFSGGYARLGPVPVGRAPRLRDPR